MEREMRAKTEEDKIYEREGKEKKKRKKKWKGR